MTENQRTIAGARHHRVLVNDATLHYVEAGDDGPPVLLVHGFPETWWAFRHLIPLLSVRHRVFAVDLRGFGDSTVADDDYTSGVAAEDLHALVEHLDVGPVHLVGQDVSGGVVFRLAAAHPEDVASLTAVESGIAGFGAERLADVTHGGAWYIGGLAAPGIPRLLFEPAARGFIERLYSSFGVSTTAVGPADVAEYARSYGRRDGFAGAAGLYRGMLTEGDELRAIAHATPLEMPVTAIGSRGKGFTHAAFSGVAAHPVTSIQLDDTGHYVAQEAPARLAETLIATFAGV